MVKTPQGQPAMTTTYGYDANGNRLSKTEPGGTVTEGSYDAQDRLLAYGNTSYTYNSNGDLTSKTQNDATVTYDYDVFGNLRKVVLDNGQMIEYVIDGRNRRIGKKIDGTLVQGFLFDDQLRPIAELDGSNSVVATYIYGTHVNVPELVVKGGTTYRIVHDHLGSPRLLVEQSTGTVVQRLDYDEWGRITLDTNPGFQPFGFAGGIYDAQTRLLRFGARDYDPQVGRWTAKDPALFLGGWANVYSYAGAAPIDFVDPTGLVVIRFRVDEYMDRASGGHVVPGRVLVTYQCHCDETGNWRLQFTGSRRWEAHYSDEQTRQNELAHVDRSWSATLEFLSHFLPYEHARYGSKCACEEAAKKAVAEAGARGASFDWSKGQPGVDDYVWYYLWKALSGG